MLTGLPASVANGTNRIAILMAAVAGITGYKQAGKLPARAVVRLLPATLAGAAAGAWVASVTPDAVLEPVLLGTMVVMAVLLAVRPKLLAPGVGEAEQAAGAPGWRPMLYLFGAGLYGGFLQAGVGFILLAVLAGVLRYDLVRANALKVTLILPWTLVVLAIFAYHDLVRWLPGLVLGLGMATGGYLGVRFAVRKSDWLRWAVLITVLGSVVAAASR